MAKKARPTEYRGIVYRSKSEAMFARWLELHARELDSHRLGYTARNTVGSGFGYTYEPSGFEVDQWQPDFLFWFTWTYELFDAQIPHIDYELIEYKPARPTQTYIDEFYKRCCVLFERFSRLKEFYYRSEFKLYWGSVFSADRGIVQVLPGCYSPDGKPTVGVEVKDWIAGFESEIRETRFDLEAR